MNISTKILAITSALTCFTVIGTPLAFAQSGSIYGNVNTSVHIGTTVTGSTTAGIGVSVGVKAGSSNAKSRADQEISRRITALNALIARIGEMKQVSASEQAQLRGSLTDQENALSSLQAKIDADSSTSTLKSDVQSIVTSYRIFLLVIPQGALFAAVDRIEAVVADMNVVGTKLSARISAAASAGANVTAAQSALTDYNAKVADATAQATAALAEIQNLQPDQGNPSVAASNHAALLNARGKVQAGQQDLLAARQDITLILKNLPKVSVSATASTTATTH